ncbi:hypothetical protein TWF730_008085 [Orbilia blumenaviensis]|uniref:NAD-dependent epimerase/dehydratase domain-containing protein n=1 Tax=Orbilia blumenaviensis TaxID=1796055 RepID=A0AAV9VCB8_9PEZI
MDCHRCTDATTRRSCRPSEIEILLYFFVNYTSLQGLDIPSRIRNYYQLVTSQAIKVLTSIPCCLYTSVSPSRGPAVLVTGGLGYVGSHVCLELLKRGYTILIIDDLRNSFSNTVQNIGLAFETSGFGEYKTAIQNMNHIPIDYGDTQALNQALVGYGRYFLIVGAIHLAASKSVAESLKNPRKYYENNVSKMERFLTALGSLGIRNVIFSSSATVYGCLPPETALKPLKEDLVPVFRSLRQLGGMLGGLTPYGISKILGEGLVARFVERDKQRNGVVFRLFNPVGCDPSGHLKDDPKDKKCRGGVMQMIMKSVRRDQVFEVYGTGLGGRGDKSCIRDFVHVADIARGIAMGLEACVYKGYRDRERLKVYNLASGGGISVKQLVRKVGLESRVAVRVRECSKREGDIAVSVGDNGKIECQLGWVPERSIEAVCKDFCHAYNLQKDRGDLN